MDRERERVGTRNDSSSLWIDFLLLPQKLEEHLAAGPAASPAPPDLISMFLEQALVNHKSVLAAGASANANVRESEIQGPSRMASKTAFLLSERAARVAVTANLTLSDIESSIVSQQHQFMLLKALIRHEKSRCLINQCNLHRWILHKVLQFHPVGSAAPNVICPAQRIGSWAVGDDIAEPLNSTVGDVSSFCNSRESCLEEERLSLEFLENVLQEDELGFPAEEPTSTLLGNETDPVIVENGGVNKEPPLCKTYKCQIMLDVGGVHFMRGKIKKAYEFFTKCADCLSSKAVQAEADSKVVKRDVPPVCPVPTERLAGYIIACRMLLEIPAGTYVGEAKKGSMLGVEELSLSSLSAPSSSQWATIACEQSRSSAKRFARMTGEVHNPRIVRCYSPEEMGSRKRSLCMPVTTAAEDNTSCHGDKKMRLSSKPESLEQDTLLNEGYSMTAKVDFKERVLQSQFQTKESCAVSPKVDEDLYSSNGSKYHTSDQIEVGNENGGTLNSTYTSVNERRSVFKSCDSTPDKRDGQCDSDCCGSGLELVVDLKGEPAEEGDSFMGLPLMKHEKGLIHAFVEDIFKGHLSWGYCLSLENDPQLSKTVRCKLAACNIVRSVLEGAPVEAFLRIGDQFENNKERVEFLLQLLLVVKSLQKRIVVTNYGPSGMDTRQIDQLPKTEASCPIFAGKVKRSINESLVPQRIQNLAMYVCCVIDEAWCWSFALKSGLIDQADVPALTGQAEPDLQQNIYKTSLSEATGFHSDSPVGLKSLAKEEVLVNLLQADTLCEIQTLTFVAQRLVGGACGKEKSLLGEGVQFPDPGCEPLLTPLHSCSQDNGPSSVRLLGEKVLDPTVTHGFQSHTLSSEIVLILLRHAFNALEAPTKDLKMVKHLYELVLSIKEKDFDSTLMLWLLERCSEPEGQSLDRYRRALPGKDEGDLLPSFEILDYMILQLIENEMWVNLADLCQWGIQFMKGIMVSESESYRLKRLLQTLKVATALRDLMPLCVKLQAAASRNHFNEDVARLGSTMWQLFEDFMCLLVGMELEGQSQTGDDTPQSRASQMGMGPPPPYPGAAGVPLVPKLSNPRVLMRLASLTAGWLHRCHAAGLTPWPLAVERYGVLAGVTAGATLPPSVTSAVYRPVPPKVSPEFGRDLFGVLLEGIVGISGVVEGDKEKGHRWLQGLADLAFEEEAYVKALQLYLQAGGVRSAHYCDRASSMPRDIFTPWVIGRMVDACRSIGAVMQAAVLCQCLPMPDHELAFCILQENTLIVDRDSAAYFECLWEVPILELLVHLHAKSGDETRVNSLISLLQQPALNVHNPPSIRQAHISTMEQRFLQRFAGELL